MKFKIMIALVLAIVTVSCLNAADRLRKEFDVDSAPLLTVNVDAANIIIETGTLGNIVAQVTLPDKDRFKLSSEQEGSSVRITLENRGVIGWLSAPFDFASGEGPEVRLQVPESCSLMLYAGAGSIKIQDMKSVIKARTGAGSIRVEESSGDAELISGSGSIRIDDFSGMVDATSDAGRVSVEDSHGDLYLGNGVGEINVYGCSGSFHITSNVGAIDFTGAVTSGDDNLIRTDIGTIDVTLYEIEDLIIDAESDLGSVTVSPLPPGADQGEHSFVYTIGSGEVGLELRSQMGDIRISHGRGELPSNDDWEEVGDDEVDDEEDSSDRNEPTEK